MHGRNYEYRRITVKVYIEHTQQTEKLITNSVRAYYFVSGIIQVLSSWSVVLICVMVAFYICPFDYSLFVFLSEMRAYAIYILYEYTHVMKLLRTLTNAVHIEFTMPKAIQQIIQKTPI